MKLQPSPSYPAEKDWGRNQESLVSYVGMERMVNMNILRGIACHAIHENSITTHLHQFNLMDTYSQIKYAFILFPSTT